MNLQGMTLVMIPEAELNMLKATLQDIQQQLKNVHGRAVEPVKYLTAIEFMAAVRIRRTKFDELVKFSKINVIKKRRKIYVPIEEVDRYFKDSSIK
jgi:hypothetical protein